MEFKHRGCTTCPKVDYHCSDCRNRVWATAMSEGPEKGRRQPFDVPTIPTILRVVRKGKVWVINCDVYIGDRIDCRKAYLTIPESKWWNNFSDLVQYEAHVRSSDLWDALGELSGMTLGFTKGMDVRHGEVLRRLFAEKFHIPLE